MLDVHHTQLHAKATELVILRMFCSRFKNRIKGPKELTGQDTYILLVDTLRIDVDDILAKVDPNLPPPLTKSQVKFNSFSIENLLGHRKGDGEMSSLPFGIRSARSPFSGSDGHESDSDSDDSDLSSRCSSPELDVTDERDPPPHARLN